MRGGARSLGGDAVKESIDWVPKTGCDASGFIRAYVTEAFGVEVPVIMHLPGACPPEEIVRRTDETADLSERSHISVEVRLADRLLDPRTPMDRGTGLPADPSARAEYDEMCDGLRAALGPSGDPRTDPVIDFAHGTGRHARAEDPETGAKSNRLSLFDEGSVKLQVAWRDAYPGYEERIDRIAQQIGFLLAKIARTMARPKASGRPA